MAAAPLPVTVAISTADRPDGLSRCLASLLAGDRVPMEIVVVDQSRGDASRGLVEGVEGGGTSAVYVKDPGTGLSASRNLALARAANPVVAFIDDDCVATPGWLAAIHSSFETTDVTCVTGSVLPLGPAEEGRYAVSSRTGTTAAIYSGSVAPWLAGTGGNLALRPDRLGEGQVFDPRLGAGSPGRAGEDLDLLRRMLREGHAIRYSPEAAVLHERQSLDRRLSTRFAYGHGVGAASGLWLRSGDRYGLKMLVIWVRMRLRLLRTGLRRHPALALREEALVLAGTLRGFIYGGFFAHRRPR